MNETLTTKWKVNDMDFFNNLGKKISQTSQNAVEKTKIFTATTKLNFDINEAKNQISEYYRQIGEIYFANYQNNPSAELLDLVVKIKEKLSEIEKMTAQIVELKGVTICPQCGAEVPADTSFCGKCGCKVQVDPPAIDTAPKCPQCGNEINSDSQFCGKCGCKIEHQQTHTDPSVEG